MSAITSSLNSLTYDTGSSDNAGRLTQGIWGSSTDELGYVDSVLNNDFGAGQFEGLVTEDLVGYTAVWDQGVTTNNTFRIAANGQVSVVPEPSTYALVGFGVLLLIVAYRRANA
jgi:hypothetical protein